MWFAGNDIIHFLTVEIKKRQELRIDLWDTEGNHKYAKYDNFVVMSEMQKYKLKSLGKYSGDAGRGLYDAS